MSDTQYTPVRPALKTLQHDQRALFSSDVGDLPGLRDGFQTRRSVINWYQAAVVRTFGFLVDEWPPGHLATDRTLLQGLVVSSARRGWASEGSDPLPTDAARQLRKRLETDRVRPASNRAYNMLRKTAGEYIGAEGDDAPAATELDPEEQANVAMRPAFQQKDLEQAHTLHELWAGFESEEKLLDWCHALDSPTNGAIKPEFSQLVANDRVALDHLLEGDTDVPDLEKQVYREQIAIHVLLPAFTVGVRRMNAGELAKRTTGGSGTHTFD